MRPPLTSILRQLASPLNTLAYLRANTCLVMNFLITDLISRLVGQMSLRKTFLPFLSTPIGVLARSICIDAGDGVSDDQRRRGEIVGAHVRVDAAFEVAVAGKHGGSDEIVLADGLGDFRRQRAGIADAGRAAEADQIEAELRRDPSEDPTFRDIPQRPASPARAMSSPTAWT